MKRNKASNKTKPDTSKIKSQTCSICVTNGCCKDVNKNYIYCGQTENYGDMLNKTFNIQIVNPKKILICDECIKSLRDATEFKLRVLSSDVFLSDLADEAAEKYEECTTLLEPIKTEVKQELTENCELPSNEYVNGSDHYDDDDYNIVVNDKEDTKDNYVIKENVNKRRKVNKLVKRKKNEGSLKSNNAVKKKTTNIKESIDTEEKDPKFSQTIKNMQENTHNLIINSNLCLFKSLRTKFACYDCKLSFFDIKELRNHASSHYDPNKLEKKCRRMTGMCNKNADISNLHCKLCLENCNDLDRLKTHLEGHGLKFHGNSHFLIPFKLEDGLKCVYCHESFYSFTRLAIHMNCHSTQNVCEICGNSYYNRISLRNHIFNQHTDKKCSKCNLVFKRISDRAKHLKTVHGTNKSVRYCLRCEMTFRYTHQLRMHMVDKHGAKQTLVYCQHCGKKLASPSYLKIHIRSVHLKERNFHCSMCEMSFFTKTDKNRHEKIHGDDRCYSCNYCSTMFKSKDSVRRHLGRQHRHLLTTEVKKN